MSTFFEPVDLDAGPLDGISWSGMAQSVEHASRAMAVLVGGHKTVTLDQEGALRFAPHLDVGMALERAFGADAKARVMQTPKGTWAAVSKAGTVLAWDDGDGPRLHPVPFVARDKGRVAPWAVSTALKLAPPRPVSLDHGDPRMPLWALPGLVLDGTIPRATQELLCALARGMALANPHLAETPLTAWLGQHTPQIRFGAVHPLARPSSIALAFMRDATYDSSPTGQKVRATFTRVLDALRAAGRIGLHDLARAPHAPVSHYTLYVHVHQQASAHQRLGWSAAWEEACAMAGVGTVFS